MNTKIRRIMSREEMENHADVFHCSKRARERSNCFDETYVTDIEPLTFGKEIYYCGVNSYFQVKNICS